MKMHYKKIWLGIAIMSVFSAGVALAENTVKGTTSGKAQVVQDKADARGEAHTQNVCERITEFADNLNQKASEKENGIKTRQQERLTNWENKTSEADYKMENLRTNWENNREAQFAKLEEAAKTDAQKSAVKTFEVAVKAAIATRQKAMDAATETFRTGMKNAIATRQGQVDGIVSASISARAAALAKVQADCAAGKDAATVRATFQNGLKGSRIQLQNDRQNVDKIGATVQALIQTRHMAVEKALGDFKTIMEKERTTLKSAFSVKASTASDATVIN